MSCLHIYIRQTCRVGTHIGDKTFLTIADIDAFIEALSNRHGPFCREAELRRSFLLQGGRDKRLERCRALGSRLDGSDGEFSLALLKGLVCFFLIMEFCLLAIDLGKAGREFLAILGKFRIDGPVFLRNECLDFLLALDDQLQRDRLHAAG